MTPKGRNNTNAVVFAFSLTSHRLIARGIKNMQFHSQTKCAKRTGWVTSELYYWHDTQNYCGFFEPSMTVQPGLHFENPETKRRFHGLVEALDLAPHLHALRPHSAILRF